jgi:hypothetical protein
VMAIVIKSARRQFLTTSDRGCLLGAKG